MRRKLGIFLMILGAVLLMAALSLLVYNCLDNRRAEEAADESLSRLYALIDENRSETAIPAYNRPSDGAMSSAELEGESYIGVLSIPSLGLELPVMKEWSYPNLRTAPCCYSGSVWTNDLVIAGHNYNSHFGRLKYINEGDKVTFTDINGNLFTYEADFTETLAPTAIDAMTSGDYPLTLFTCNYSGQARVALRCISS